jgi:hypothetical protein
MIASDTHRFDVVWKGQWYWLGSLTDHHAAGVDPTGPVRLLLDRLYQKHLAPSGEIAIPPNPLP